MSVIWFFIYWSEVVLNMLHINLRYPHIRLLWNVAANLHHWVVFHLQEISKSFCEPAKCFLNNQWFETLQISTSWSLSWVHWVTSKNYDKSSKLHGKHRIPVQAAICHHDSLRNMPLGLVHYPFEIVSDTGSLLPGGSVSLVSKHNEEELTLRVHLQIKPLALISSPLKTAWCNFSQVSLGISDNHKYLFH